MARTMKPKNDALAKAPHGASVVAPSKSTTSDIRFAKLQSELLFFQNRNKLLERDVLMLRGDYAASAELFERAALLAEGNFAQAEIRGKLGELAFKRGDIERAIDSFEAALRLLGRYVPRNFTTLLVLFFWEVGVQVLHTLAPRWFVGRRRQQPYARAQGRRHGMGLGRTRLGQARRRYDDQQHRSRAGRRPRRRPGDRGRLGT